MASVLCNSALESSRAATERARRASKYGSEDVLEWVERRESLDLLRLLVVLGDNEEEETRGGRLGREVEAEVVWDVVVVVVVVVVIIEVVVSFRGHFLVLGVFEGLGIFSSSVLSPLNVPAAAVSVAWWYVGGGSR